MAQNSDMASRIVAAASQGAVGAVVGSVLSAVAEPVVNRVLVKRVPLQQAIEEIDLEAIKKFFKTTLPTNFIKFPFFEIVNMIMNTIPISPELRGTVTGIVFTTCTLPITNFRYRQSMGMPIEISHLYQAYLPTVGRDILYGMARNRAGAFLHQRDPAFASTNTGRFVNMFFTVMASCVFSAPGNEIRGYMLQPKDKQIAFGEFFEPAKFLRSTIVGTLIMSTSLSTGAVCTPKVEELVSKLRAYLAKNELSYLIIVLFLLHQYLNWKKKELVDDKKAVKK